MGTILEPKHIAFDAVYDHFSDKVDNGRFSANRESVLVVINHVLDHKLGCPVASSYTGIGGSITSGFISSNRY